MKLKFTTISVVTVILTLCSNGFGMDYFEQGHSNISQNMTVLNKELADAITNNKMEDICRLIQYGADVDTRGGGQTTALIRAVEHEDINMVRWLLDKGADANLGELKRVMSVYMGNGNTIINKFVQENEQRIDTPLIKAIEMGNLSIITMLVDNGADVNDQEPLRYAVMNSVNVDIISYLVKKGANVKNHDILCEAIGSLRYDRNSMNIVKRLIEYKDSLNISCSSALEVALSRLFDIRFNDSGNTEAINDLEETINLNSQK